MADSMQRIPDVITLDMSCQIHSSVVAHCVSISLIISNILLMNACQCVQYALLSLHSLKPYVTLTQNLKRVGIQCKYFTQREKESCGYRQYCSQMLGVSLGCISPWGLLKEIHSLLLSYLWRFCVSKISVILL